MVRTADARPQCSDVTTASESVTRIAARLHFIFGMVRGPLPRERRQKYPYRQVASSNAAHRGRTVSGGMSGNIFRRSAYIIRTARP